MTISSHTTPRDATTTPATSTDRKTVAASEEALTTFWALPGGFVVPLAVLGLVTVQSGRRGEALPRSAGWLLLGWVLVCVWIIGSSGFLLGLVPAALLLWPRRRGTDTR